MADGSNGEIKAGDVLAGKYRVERVIGAGGMGYVVEATHLALEDRVAIKVMAASMRDKPGVAARFLREAQAAVRIKSPHIARAVDVGTLENGAPYMVMEFLQGHDLGQVLKAQGPLAVETACQFALQACEALAAAHTIGIIHRDIKPANLFVTRAADGGALIKVLDFGISKVNHGDGALTHTQAAMGSPLYMSPEQMRSARDVDNRADIWSLGVVVFELLTGRLPFEAESMPQLIALILESTPPSMREHFGNVPPELDQLVQRCLERDIAKRPANVGELALGLAPFGGELGRASAQRCVRILEGAGVFSHDPGLTGQHVAATGQTTRVTFGTTQNPTRRQSLPIPLMVGGLGVIVAAGLVGTTVVQTPATTAPSSVSAAVKAPIAVAEPSASAAVAPAPSPSVAPPVSASAAPEAAEAPKVAPMLTRPRAQTPAKTAAKPDPFGRD